MEIEIGKYYRVKSSDWMKEHNISDQRSTTDFYVFEDGSRWLYSEEKEFQSLIPNRIIKVAIKTRQYVRFKFNNALTDLEVPIVCLESAVMQILKEIYKEVSK